MMMDFVLEGYLGAGKEWPRICNIWRGYDHLGGAIPMKITDPGIIKSGERELFDGIIADLDWKAVDEIFRTNHDLEIPEDV